MAITVTLYQYDPENDKQTVESSVKLEKNGDGRYLDLGSNADGENVFVDFRLVDDSKVQWEVIHSGVGVYTYNLEELTRETSGRSSFVTVENTLTRRKASGLGVEKL